MFTFTRTNTKQPTQEQCVNAFANFFTKLHQSADLIMNQLELPSFSGDNKALCADSARAFIASGSAAQETLMANSNQQLQLLEICTKSYEYIDFEREGALQFVADISCYNSKSCAFLKLSCYTNDRLSSFYLAGQDNSLDPLCPFVLTQNNVYDSWIVEQANTINAMSDEDAFKLCDIGVLGVQARNLEEKLESLLY